VESRLGLLAIRAACVFYCCHKADEKQLAATRQTAAFRQKESCFRKISSIEKRLGSAVFCAKSPASIYTFSKKQKGIEDAVYRNE